MALYQNELDLLRDVVCGKVRLLEVYKTGGWTEFPAHTLDGKLAATIDRGGLSVGGLLNKGYVEVQTTEGHHECVPTNKGRERAAESEVA